jgi:hypothetical protein
MSIAACNPRGRRPDVHFSDSDNGRGGLREAIRSTKRDGRRDNCHGDQQSRLGSLVSVHAHLSTIRVLRRAWTVFPSNGESASPHRYYSCLPRWQPAEQKRIVPFYAGFTDAVIIGVATARAKTILLMVMSLPARSTIIRTLSPGFTALKMRPSWTLKLVGASYRLTPPCHLT